MYKEMKKDFDKKFPCINAGCDNDGCIAVRVNDGLYGGCDEWEQEQCQYCFEVRFPYFEFIKEQMKKAVEEYDKETHNSCTAENCLQYGGGCQTCMYERRKKALKKWGIDK